DLLPAIDRLFRRAGLSPADLRGGAVAVSAGPGGFTGLRIAIAAAKMLAETLQVRLIGVPSALVAAEAHAGEGPIIVALACKNETFWCTRLERSAVNGHAGDSRVATRPWGIVGEPGIVHPTSFDPRGVKSIIADE